LTDSIRNNNKKQIKKKFTTKELYKTKPIDSIKEKLLLFLHSANDSAKV
jgi:hypothetical protein